ncbi:regulatory protein RecX [uncultured Bacteroides sp.]|uniref:regulatory protein RecX n=1 Tax=uncultured Bacteroides sp. TaxID=162156 RepID=UPI0026316F93|nr:regulatory protein RecX [uncultured Bacteroides sp.]
MKEYTENELKFKAEAYCSSAEHCSAEVEAKLQAWGADAEVTERIVAHLRKERYLDDTRFCKAFVRDKYRFTRWGRMKIVQALRMKHLPSDAIQAGLEEIDEEEYSNGLKELLRQKARSVTGKNEYERNAKLIRFAVGRGFAMDEVMRFVKQTDSDDYLD